MGHQIVSEEQLIALLLTDEPDKMLHKSIGIQTDKCAAKKRESRVMNVVFGGIAIAIFSLIVFSIWLTWEVNFNTMKSWNNQGDPLALPPSFSFSDMFDRDLKPRNYITQWIGAVNVYSHVERNGSLISRNLDTGQETILADSSIMNSSTSYMVSVDQRYILLAYKIKKIWKNIYYNNYKLYDTISDLLLPFPNDANVENETLHHAQLTTNGSIIFTHNYNLYFQATPTSESVRITSNGLHNSLYNGVPDWTYSEIFGSDHLFWSSPDGRYVAFLQLNGSGVPQHGYSYYGSTDRFTDDTRTYPYSQAGNTDHRQQTKAALFVVDTNNLGSPAVYIHPPQHMIAKEHYIVSVTWRTSTSLAVMWTNRPQNQSAITLCQIDGQCIINHEEMIVGGWIEPWPQMLFINNGSSYLTILSKPEGETGEWPHIAVISSQLNGTGEVQFVTEGQEEITSIEGYDEDLQIVYYITTTGDPKKRLLYSLSIKERNKHSEKPICLSCDLQPSCSYASVSFSPSSKYYNLHCQGPNIPYNLLISTNGTFSDILEDNADVEELLKNRDLPRTQFIQIPIGEGYKAWAKITIPPASDRDQDRKWYPVLFESASNPGDQSVDERFSIGFPAFLASSHDAVYVKVDGRGTAGRGDRYKHLIYRRMATVDADDQILAARWLTTALHMTDKLLTNLRIADKTRFAIWGESYGGLLALHALANESNTFHCGIAAGAITDMRYTASVTAERFMGYATEADNQGGYERSNILNKLDLLRYQQLLIVHGTADTDVPLSSSAHLMQGLNKAGIQHKQHIYPDQDNEDMKDKHFYKLITDFLQNICFKIRDNY